MGDEYLRPRRKLVGAAVVAAALGAAALAAAAVTAVSLVRISTDPYTNATSQHATEVEPDTFAYGSTIVAAFQVGRFTDGGASNVGYATSTDDGSTWANGFLPATTKYATPAGPYDRDTDPGVAYDKKHDVWIIESLAMTETGGPSGLAVIASRSTDGGLTFQAPVVVATGVSPDKSWIVCDNTETSPFYGNCYVEWDDNGIGNRIELNTSTDGGLTWSPPKTTADAATGIGGQPLVRPDGTVVVPIDDCCESSLLYFTSTDGGTTWSATTPITDIIDHAGSSGLRLPALPSAEIDKKGRVYVFWQDCRFRSGCSANDIVYVRINTNNTVTKVKRVPIDARSSSVDHFIPGIAVDRTTSGKTTRLALTYYFLPDTGCVGDACKLKIGFVSSGDGGATWSSPTVVGGPMKPSWLPDTTQGRMFGDYISTSFVGGSARPGIIVAAAPSGDVFDVAAYTTDSGLGTGTTVATGDEAPVPGAASDHSPLTVPATSR
jgi:hypothetical protein